MLFNSIEFLIFLPIVVIFFFLLPHRFRWMLLLLASCYFYMVWKPEYILLILFSTLVNYIAGLLMEKQPVKEKRKIYLIISLLISLGLLFVFKYFNFFISQFGKVYTLISAKESPIGRLNILLPMGISFYTFQTLSYSIDVYRGNRKAERHFGYFALYVTFFPQLVAGPIERSERLLPQLRAPHSFSYQNLMDGIIRISWGFFKKVIIADRVAVLVNSVYNNAYEYSKIYLVMATLGFAVQIYCDFSGYSDIAIGSAKIMGIDLMENFKVPYFSKSINEFWTRWHISLSTWFKDYLYIPLGGNRCDQRWKYYRNILIVFLVSGFWHGANWTFIIWGFLHGAVQIGERIQKGFNSRLKLPDILRMFLTFAFVCLAWIFFRANNIHDAIYIISHLGLDGTKSFLFALLGNSTRSIISLDKPDLILLGLATLVLFTYEGFQYTKQKSYDFSYFTKGLISIGLIVLVVIFGYYGTNTSNTFIYFQF